jgi:hypothetical protein
VEEKPTRYIMWAGFYTTPDGKIKRDGRKIVTNVELTTILEQFNSRLSVVEDEILVI